MKTSSFILIASALSLYFAAAGTAQAGPFTAAAYIKAALSSSPQMRGAEESFRQAENAYKVELLNAALPSLTLSMGETFYDNLDTRLRADRGDVSSSLSASLNLYDSASSPLTRIKTAKLDYESAKLTLFTARQAEALKALNRFYALYSSQQRIGIAEMNLKSRERQYKDTDEQYRSGTRSKIEVTQSEGDKLQSELSLAQAEAAQIKALLAFNELVNAGPDDPQEVEVSTRVPDIKLPLPRSDVDKALRDNFAMRRQRLTLEKARLASRTTVFSNYPRLSVDASWSKSALGILGTPGGSWTGNPSYRLGAALSFPFGFFGAQNYLKIDSADSVLKAYELDLESAIRAMTTSVLTAQKDIELQVKSRQLLDFQVKAQKDSTENLSGEYSLGGASFLQLDSSQTKLLDASNSRISSVNDLDIALANYRVLLGEKIWE